MKKYILKETIRFKELTDLLAEKGFKHDCYSNYGLVAMFVDFDSKKINYCYSVTGAACYCSNRFNPINAGFIIDNFDEIVNKGNFELLDENYYRKR